MISSLFDPLNKSFVAHPLAVFFAYLSQKSRLLRRVIPVVDERGHVAPQDYRETQHSIRVARAYLPVLEAAYHREAEASPRNGESQFLCDLFILLLVFQVKHLRTHLNHHLKHFHPLV